MAEKKVILKDGTDELLPKTSASMVFTESGQTVESALKNAGGGGGTGDSGIVDITYIISKLDLTNGGTMDSTDLSTLKGYMSAGKVLKATIGGVTLLFNYDTSSSTIVMTSAPVVSMGMYGMMMSISYLIDSNTGEYIGANDESNGKLVNQIIPSNYTATKICQMTGYMKPSSYAAITPEDTIDSAIGKLEAGIGSGGTGGGGDNIYWIPSDILNLESGDTYEEILAALGGSLDDIYEAVKSGKIFYSNTESNISYISFCIDVYFPFMQYAAFFSFTVRSNSYSPLANYEVYCNTSSPRQSYVKIIYIEGYKLNTNIYFLSSISNTEDISTAVGGESGLKKIIQAVKDGNRLVIRGESSNLTEGTVLSTDVFVNAYEEKENGDLTISYSLFGIAQGGSYYGGTYYVITYTKASNTFAIQSHNIAQTIS